MGLDRSGCGDCFGQVTRVSKRVGDIARNVSKQLRTRSADAVAYKEVPGCSGWALYVIELIEEVRSITSAIEERD
jgi:phage host-nuclease inhibitor protein Gam